MKTLLIFIVALVAIYLIGAVGGFLIGLIFNGKFDQSKESVGRIAKRSFRWPLRILGR